MRYVSYIKCKTYYMDRLEYLSCFTTSIAMGIYLTLAHTVLFIAINSCCIPCRVLKGTIRYFAIVCIQQQSRNILATAGDMERDKLESATMHQRYANKKLKQKIYFVSLSGMQLCAA